MAVNNNTTKFFASGAISLSQLRDTFRGNTGSVSLSELKRKTTDVTTAPYVYDATENATVPTTNADLAFSKYRGASQGGTVKEIVLQQSGTDTDISIDGYTTQWNSNFGKVIPKKFEVTGTVGASTTGNTSLTVNSNLAGKLRLQLTEGAKIYGEGGTGGSAGGGAGNPGGNAILLQQNGVTVAGNTNSEIRGGGGGGSGGNSGQPGGQGQPGQTGTPGQAGLAGGQGQPGQAGNPGGTGTTNRTQFWNGGDETWNRNCANTTPLGNTNARTIASRSRNISNVNGPGGAGGAGGPGGARGNGGAGGPGGVGGPGGAAGQGGAGGAGGAGGRGRGYGYQIGTLSGNAGQPGGTGNPGGSAPNIWTSQNGQAGQPGNPGGAAPNTWPGQNGAGGQTISRNVTLNYRVGGRRFQNSANCIRVARNQNFSATGGRGGAGNRGNAGTAGQQGQTGQAGGRGNAGTAGQQGQSGNSGNAGGDWGTASSGNAGAAIKRANTTNINYTLSYNGTTSGSTTA